MAPKLPMAGTNGLNTPSYADTSAPLADYFFIAGIESSQVYDKRLVPPLAPPVQYTIDEDEPLRTTDDRDRPMSPRTPTDFTAKPLRYSWEARKSMSSIFNVAEPQTPTSTRSSAATIKAPKLVTPNTAATKRMAASDDSFDEALRKFASERDSFVEGMNISAGIVASPTQRKPRPRTIRITQEDGTTGGVSASRSGVGSITRRLSTMKSARRASTFGVNRNVSVRTSRRMSGYTSVIPAPEPLKMSPDIHPLKKHYEPVLLDRYPPKSMPEETKRRNPFPDYVPMFAFPNDVNVVSSDERPRSTWHGFAMTSHDNAKLYGVCVTVWLPLHAEASDALERQCEEWRVNNMTTEERELASSLGERLSSERAKLSKLLAKLPSKVSGSDEREQLEDEISAVEEKIGLMADLLRPVRHGAASKIDGLTEGDTGFWIPRSYGILGRDGGLTSFWKEWLRAVVVPMTGGAVLRVPPSSPKVGTWQPLERYVVNLCVEALSPITSITQVEVSVRDLRLYARKEAINELPGSRNTDIYALFRCLKITNIVTLFEYALAESRIIFLSSHTAMLQLACSALISLLYPLKWASILIPVLPQRLIPALDAPCPYIVGIERRYEKLELPEDDFVMVDLDDDLIEATHPPVELPRPQRRKLMALLQASALHHNRYGVPTGPPPYAVEAYPHDSFGAENPQIFTSNPAPSNLAHCVSASSTTFGEHTPARPSHSGSIFNAFLHARGNLSRGSDRPSTSSTSTSKSQASAASPPSTTANPSPVSSFTSAPFSRNDSGLALQASLKEKRSGHLDSSGRRNSSFRFQPSHVMRRSSGAGMNHASPHGFNQHPNMSTSALPEGRVGSSYSHSNYAPSIYAQSTLPGSTIMPSVLMQPVQSNVSMKWMEGHCLIRRDNEGRSNCNICDEKCEEDSFKCNGCGIVVHSRCLQSVCLVCPLAFQADQVRAAFVRCFASLFYTYRRFLHPASGERRRHGLIYHFSMDQFLKSVPHGDSEYMHMLRDTQAFNEFIHERESNRAEEPSIKLFDEIILAKRNRGRSSIFSKSQTSFLSDTSDHLWRSATATPAMGHFVGDAGALTGRIPAKLDPALMKEPRSIQGAPRILPIKAKRKPVASLLTLSARMAEA